MADMNAYRSDFGDDYYEFYVDGVKFLAINTQYFWGEPSGLEEQETDQKIWLRTILMKRQKKFKHVVLFQHVPWFYQHPEEQTSINSIGMVKRKDYANMMFYNKVDYVFSGHVHGNYLAKDEGLEVVVTSALSCQFMGDDPGYRIVKVFEEKLQHKFFLLDETPDVNLSLSPDN